MAMTKERVCEAFDACLALVNKYGNNPAPKRMEDHDCVVSLSAGPAEREEVLAHFAFVCVEGKKLALEDRREKAMRWLGFIQGALWVSFPVTLEDLKKMNMPADAELSKERV